MTKVSELTGEELEKWVAKGQGYKPIEEDFHHFIKREKINVRWHLWAEQWCAYIGEKDNNDNERMKHVMFSETPAEAAYRCFVASKFGEEVNV